MVASFASSHRSDVVPAPGDVSRYVKSGVAPRYDQAQERIIDALHATPPELLPEFTSSVRPSAGGGYSWAWVAVKTEILEK